MYDIAQNAETDEIRRLATEFAEEEEEHANLLEERLKITKEVGKDWGMDIDPPHMPE